MPYTNPENMTSLLDIFRYSNEVTSNIFGGGILIGLYLIIVLYLTGRRHDVWDSMAVAGYTTVITGFFIYLGGLINDWGFAIVVLMFVISTVGSYWSKSA